MTLDQALEAGLITEETANKLKQKTMDHDSDSARSSATNSRIGSRNNSNMGSRRHSTNEKEKTEQREQEFDIDKDGNTLGKSGVRTVSPEDLNKHLVKVEEEQERSRSSSGKSK